MGVSAATVTVNGRAAIAFRTGRGKSSAAKRAQLAFERLRSVVEHGAGPDSLFVKTGKHSARVFSGETLICVAGSRDAKKAGVSPAALARMWMSRTKILLAMPPIILSARELIIPLGEQRRVDIGGAATGPIHAASQTSAVATVAIEARGRYIRIAGKRLGDSVVDITVEGESAHLPVFIKKYAGQMARQPVAEVTGNPCSYSILDYAARQATLRNVVLEPGARIDIPSIEYIKRPLVSGQKRTVTANVRITGEGYIPFLARISVQVRSIAMPHRDPKELFYSNDPERITGSELLFGRGKLRHRQVEQNPLPPPECDRASARIFLIEIINPESAHGIVSGVKGCGRPDDRHGGGGQRGGIGVCVELPARYAG